MKTIGIVCEGPRDYDMISSVILQIVGQEVAFRLLQPDSELGAELGAGWKGVLHWCETYSADLLSSLLRDVRPTIDLLIVQIDADVARREKEVYCYRVDLGCKDARQQPLNCSIAKEGACPQQLPPNPLCDGSIQGRVDYLSQLIDSLLKPGSETVVITVPSDSTDAWILAAYEDEMQDVESIDSPWDIISSKKEYHGVRIPSHSKNKRQYGKLIEKVCQNWSVVTQKCAQAKLFEELVMKACV